MGAAEGQLQSLVALASPLPSLRPWYILSTQAGELSDTAHPPFPRFLVFLRYQCYYGSPLLTYLEYPILIVQDVILLLCVFHFNGNMRQAGPYAAVFVSSWFVLGLQKWLIDLAMHLCTLISAASKFVQLRHLWETQDSGAVSALTWGLAAYTCAARIVTTLMTTTDFAILIRFVIMLALNIWVTLTVLQYQKAGSKDK